ncbi:MAG: hypothetical protein IMZ43_12420 [Thermoplasmata archaeon]|nr:hypothetical protein [Thermoplasmata archaeon]
MEKLNNENWSKLFTIIKPEDFDATWILPNDVVDKCNPMAMSSFRTLNFTDLILEYIGKNNGFSEKEKQLLFVFSKSFSHKFHCCHHFVQLLSQIYNSKELNKEKDFLYMIDFKDEIQTDMRKVVYYGTIYYESFIYHLLSSIDNLRILIHLTVPKYVDYRTRTYHKALDSLKHRHAVNEEITKYLFKEDELWINNLYKVRTEIYHNYSEPLEPTNITFFPAGEKTGLNYIDTSIDLRVYNASLTKRPHITLDELLAGIQMRLFLLFYNITYLQYFYRKPEKLNEVVNIFRVFCDPEEVGKKS